jgi:hypothetical protein
MLETPKNNVPKVFISSTVEDLREYPEAARDAALAAGLYPVMQEYFSASANRPLEECMKEVDGCDALVVIVAHRHGWTPPDQPDFDAKPGVKSIKENFSRMDRRPF